MIQVAAGCDTKLGSSGNVNGCGLSIGLAIVTAEVGAVDIGDLSRFIVRKVGQGIHRHATYGVLIVMVVGHTDVDPIRLPDPINDEGRECI